MLKNLSANVVGAIYIFISALMYAILPILTKLAYTTGLQPTYLLWLRYLFAFIFLTVWLLFLKKKVISFSPLVILQGTFFVTSGILYFLCLQYLTAGLCSVVFFTYPVIVALLALIFFKEKLTSRLLFGLILVVAGIVMISDLTGNSPANISARGLVYCILSCSTYAGYILVGQKNVVSGSPLTLTASLALMGVLFVPVIFGQSPGFFESLTAIQITITLSIALFSTVIPIIFLLYGVQKIGASRSSLISTVEPALTIIIAYLALGEVMTSIQMIGTVLVLTSMFLALPSQKKDAPKNRL